MPTEYNGYFMVLLPLRPPSRIEETNYGIRIRAGGVNSRSDHSTCLCQHKESAKDSRGPCTCSSWGPACTEATRSSASRTDSYINLGLLKTRVAIEAIEFKAVVSVEILSARIRYKAMGKLGILLSSLKNLQFHFPKALTLTMLALSAAGFRLTDNCLKRFLNKDGLLRHWGRHLISGLLGGHFTPLALLYIF